MGTLENFVSSRKTVFDMKLLSSLEFEVLLTKLSFNDIADIYNTILSHEESDSGKGSENGEEGGGR